MKSLSILGLTACIMITAFSLTAFIRLNAEHIQKDFEKTDGPGFVVLELFTSEGCSSCPPADDLLAKVQKETEGKPIYLLAYHVDYWDKLGWKDPYSSVDFSNRQMEYAHWLNVSSIYTPQIIVNGKVEFVGSDESAIRKSISAELTYISNTTLLIRAHPDSGKLNVQFQVTHAGKGSYLLIAILQKAAQSKVERGENSGRTLSHVQIVRKLQNEPLGASGIGKCAIQLPKGFGGQNWEVVGLIQDQNNGRIFAAAKAELDDGALVR